MPYYRKLDSPEIVQWGMPRTVRAATTPEHAYRSGDVTSREMDCCGYPMMDREPKHAPTYYGQSSPVDMDDDTV